MGAQRGATSASPLMVTRVIHGFFEAVCFHYASSSARCSCITASCNAGKFGPEREERISRGEFFWQQKKQRGLSLGTKRRNLSQDDGCPCLLFPPSLVFWGGQYSWYVSRGKAGGWEGTEKSEVQSLLEHPICLSSPDLNHSVCVLQLRMHLLARCRK